METLQNVWNVHQQLIILMAAIGFIFPFFSAAGSLVLEGLGYKSSLLKELELTQARLQFVEKDVTALQAAKFVKEIQEGDEVIVVPPQIG